jgi:hypothetical protein
MTQRLDLVRLDAAEAIARRVNGTAKITINEINTAAKSSAEAASKERRRMYWSAKGHNANARALVIRIEVF